MEMLVKILNPGIIDQTLRITTPILFAALAGCLNERSGVINIALEGIMIMGAFAAAVGSYFYGAWVGILFGITAGGIMGFIHAFMSVTVKANQIISATAINIFALGFPNIIVPVLWTGYHSMTPVVPVIKDISLPVIAKIPVIGKMFGSLNPIVYIAFLLVPAVHFFLFKTKTGLRIRAVGEHPRAADTVGVNVAGMRYIAVTLSGVLAGFGGAFLSIAYQSQFSQAMTAGRGFIGLAAMIFGRWRPFGALIACVIFGFADAFQASAQAAGVSIPSDLLLSLPYVLTLVALAGLIGKKAVGPAANGKPYIKD